MCFFQKIYLDERNVKNGRRPLLGALNPVTWCDLVASSREGQVINL